MSNERTALVIIGVLALAFVIAVYEHLQVPLRPYGGLGASMGSQVAGVIYAMGVLLLVGGGIAAWRRNHPNDFLRTVAIWLAIFAALGLVIALLTGQFSTPSELSL